MGYEEWLNDTVLFHLSIKFQCKISVAGSQHFESKKPFFITKTNWRRVREREWCKSWHTSGNYWSFRKRSNKHRIHLQCVYVPFCFSLEKVFNFGVSVTGSASLNHQTRSQNQNGNQWYTKDKPRRHATHSRTVLTCKNQNRFFSLLRRLAKQKTVSLSCSSTTQKNYICYSSNMCPLKVEKIDIKILDSLPHLMKKVLRVCLQIIRWWKGMNINKIK